MRTDELDFDLPEELIAATPAAQRDAARLMVARRDTGTLEHRHIHDLAEDASLLRPGDLLVFNRSRVIPARFAGRRTGTGGQVHGLYLCSDDAGRWEVMLESRGTLRQGERIELSADAAIMLEQALGEGRWSAALSAQVPTVALLERIGVMPLPPYIRRARRKLGLAEDDDADRQRYNTVYADETGSVAAPTAGLHFTPELLARLQARGVRKASVILHVGIGTFLPVRTNRLEDHAMHAERYVVPAATLQCLRDARRDRRRIVVVGTTAVRTLESLPDDWHRCDQDLSGQTRLFIHPGCDFHWRFTDALLTNFHLPRSTLLAMVASLPAVGLPLLKAWYAQAVAQRYRFFSYGDAMLVV